MTKFKVGDIVVAGGLVEGDLYIGRVDRYMEHHGATIYEVTALDSDHGARNGFSLCFYETSLTLFQDMIEEAPGQTSAKDKHKCHCAVFDMINFGCKCGGV